MYQTDDSALDPRRGSILVDLVDLLRSFFLVFFQLCFPSLPWGSCLASLRLASSRFVSRRLTSPRLRRLRRLAGSHAPVFVSRRFALRSHRPVYRPSLAALRFPKRSPK